MKNRNRSTAGLAKLLFTCLILLFFVSHEVKAQCAPSFSYTQLSPIRYQFINTTSPSDSGGYTVWSVHGPGVTYQSFDSSPSFYFPVNGTYYINLQISGYVPCPGTYDDSITISGLTSVHNCQAGMTYYPTTGGQFEFDDASTSPDTIVNYSWHAETIDGFFQANGFDKGSVLSLWSYNSCRYSKYIVTHYIATISGCLSKTIDTVHTYCSCASASQPFIHLDHDSITHTYVLSDSGSVGFPGSMYWQIGIGDSVIFSRNDTAYVSDSYTGSLQVCLNLYDTTRHCQSAACDTFTLQRLSTGINSVTEQNDLKLYTSTGPKLNMLYSGSLPAQAVIYDVQGKMILETKMTSTHSVIDISNNTDGLYLVKISSRDGAIQTGKYYLHNGR